MLASTKVQSSQVISSSAHGTARFITRFARRGSGGNILLLLALRLADVRTTPMHTVSYNATTLQLLIATRPKRANRAEETRRWTSCCDAIYISIRDNRRRPNGIALHMHWRGSMCSRRNVGRAILLVICGEGRRRHLQHLG